MKYALLTVFLAACAPVPLVPVPLTGICIIQPMQAGQQGVVAVRYHCEPTKEGS